MDYIVEQLFVKENTNKEKFMKYAFIVLGSIAIILCAIIISTINMPILYMLLIFGIYGLYYLINQFYCEVEYSVVNGQFDIDIIYAKSRRKKIVTFECKNVSEMGSFKDLPKNRDYLLMANESAQNLIYLTFSSKSGIKTVVIQPDNRVKDAIKNFIPRSVSLNVL